MSIPDRTETQRPTWTAPARREHPVFNGIIAVLCAILAYAGLTSAARSPDFGEASQYADPVATATLTFRGDDIIITGSLGHMFETPGTFVGPNRTAKVDRALPPIDVLAIARSFTEMRIQLASLRSAPADPTDLPHSTVGSTLLPPVPAEEEGPKISVAAIDPALISSSALDAIDGIAPDPDAPMPLMISERAAYARANLPATDFTVVRNTAGKVVSDKELWCLATAIYFESRGENYRGQVAVAQVVLNRLQHPIYPKTICGVVFQNQNRRNACQFSFACDGIPERVTDRRSWDQAEEIAEGAVRGSLYLTEVGAATHYHATYVYPHWAPRMKKVVKIGLHVFYQFKSGWRFG